jgi:hypothetical protein
MICVEAAQEMRAGPSEPVFRSGLQTTPSRCGQEPSVVSVGVKASGTYPEQVRIRETNESEPSMTHRYLSNVVKTRGGWNSWDKLVGCLMTGQAAAGVEGA